MVERGFDRDVIKTILPLFDFLTVIRKEDMRKGVEYIRDIVQKSKGLKRIEKKTFEEFLNKYFIPTWLRPKLIDMFNYNLDDKGDWQREM